MEMRPGRVVVRREEIAARVEALAREIGETYGTRPVTLVGVLDGCIVFLGDLLKRLRMPLEVVFVKVSTYGDGVSPGRAPTISEGDVTRAAGRHALVVDDIYDTGATLSAVVEAARAAGALSVRTCVFLEKERAHEQRIAVDFVGVKVADEFVVGYGLDYAGRYRDLPDVAVLEGFDEPRSIA